LTPTQRRLLRQSERIQGTAVSLAPERGPDGFTMDVLAAAADVSRRTLFNQVGDEMPVILGPVSLEFGPAQATGSLFREHLGTPNP
jgi:transcriptional regulator, TetR family